MKLVTVLITGFKIVSVIGLGIKGVTLLLTGYLLDLWDGRLTGVSVYEVWTHSFSLTLYMQRSNYKHLYI